MVSFLEFINEKLITLDRKRPNYNQVIILAGGAGSGKGFVIKNLLGVDGKKFDVDDLKTKALKSTGIRQKVKDQFDIDLDKLDLKNADDVSTLHNIVSTLRLDKKSKDFMYSTIKGDNKPNLIYDVTLKDLQKLETISSEVQKLGYEKENIHIVWVVNDVNTAIQQNAKRDRRVAKDILIDTHELVSYTISNILKKNTLRKYMDGDFWFVFNKQFTDSVLNVSDNGGSYIKDAVYFKVKEKSKNILKISEISDNYIDKIKAYVPNPEVWK